MRRHDHTAAQARDTSDPDTVRVGGRVGAPATPGSSHRVPLAWTTIANAGADCSRRRLPIHFPLGLTPGTDTRTMTATRPGSASDALVESVYAWRRLVASLALATIGGVGLWSVVVILPAVQAEFDV